MQFILEETRKVLFKKRIDKFVFIFMHFLMIGTYMFEFLVILPKIYGDGFSSSLKNCHIIAGTWILINVIMSFWKFVLIDPGSGSQVLPSVLKPGWKYCWKCEANFPPRSHHCYYCDVCVLVRDHHCVIGANCVGYKNRRYFLQLNFYLWLALLYANILNMDFQLELYYSLRYKALLTMFMPLLAWIFGVTEGETLMMAIFASFCIVSFLYSTAVLMFHMKNTFKGRTTHEVTTNVGLEYDIGLVENLKETFGENWKVSWISPFIKSPLPGDGMSFREKESLLQSGKNL